MARRARHAFGAIVGLASSGGGAWLRLDAADIVRPDTFSISALRESTTWAARERALQDLGLALFIFGLAVLFVVMVSWLRAPAGSNKRG